MARYTRVAAEAAAQPPYADVGFLRIACAPIQAAVRAEALAWVAALCEGMRAPDLAALQVTIDSAVCPRSTCRLEYCVLQCRACVASYMLAWQSSARYIWRVTLIL